MDALPIRAEPRPIGRSTLRAFPLAYGTWRFSGTSVRDARAKIDAALEVGVNLFDHADIYGGAGALRVHLSRADWYAILAASQGAPHP